MRRGVNGNGKPPPSRHHKAERRAVPVRSHTPQRHTQPSTAARKKVKRNPGTLKKKKNELLPATALDFVRVQSGCVFFSAPGRGHSLSTIAEHDAIPGVVAVERARDLRRHLDCLLLQLQDRVPDRRFDDVICSSTGEKTFCPLPPPPPCNTSRSSQPNPLFFLLQRISSLSSSSSIKK